MNRVALQGARQKVMVVDDDVFSREVVRRKLGFWGVTDIHMAEDGRLGLCLLDTLTCAPDFVICDIFMPDMDGIEFIAALAKRHYVGGLILMTGVNRDMLEVAQTMATETGLRLLGAFTKPLDQEPLGQVMGLSAL